MAQGVAIVTGGGSGIGAALTRALVNQGVFVLVADINEVAARKVAAACGSRAKPCLLDVRDANAFRACVEDVVREHGRLDYLFNNAGIGIAGESYEIPLETWKHIIDINVLGVVNGVAAAYPVMVKQKSGHIINTASLAGLVAVPLFAPYSMTKHAVVGLSNSLRAEAAALGVKVSVLCPAAIETPLLDSGNPPGLPAISWIPDVRRFLTKLAGAPYPADRLAEETLQALAKNQAVIVVPGRARWVWRLARWFPSLVAKVNMHAAAAERAQTVRSTH